MLKRNFTCFFLLIFCSFLQKSAFAQIPPNTCGCFEKFVKFQEKIYAHDGQGIFYSEGLGETWQNTGISENIVDLAANDGMLIYISYATSVDTNQALPISYTNYHLNISRDGINFENVKSLTGAGTLMETTSYTLEDIVLLNDSTIYWFYAWHSARGASTERQSSFFTNFGENERFEKNYFENDYAFANGTYARPQKGSVNHTLNADFSSYSFYPILVAPSEYPEAFFSYKNKFHAWFSNGQLFRTDTIHVWDSISGVDLKGAFVSDGAVYKKKDDGIFKTLDDDFLGWNKVYNNEFNTPNLDDEPAIGFFDEVFLISNENCENYRSIDEGVTWATFSAGSMPVQTVIDLQLMSGDTFLGIPIFGDTTFVENLFTSLGCDSTVTTRIMFTTDTKHISPENPKFTIYPNPHAHSAYLSFRTKRNLLVKIHLFDALGNRLFSDEFTFRESGDDFSIFKNKNDLPSGVYFLKIEVKGQIFVEKIIRQ